MVAGATIPVKLEFQGHYGEKDLTLKVPRDDLKACQSFVKINIIWSPYTKMWEAARAYDGLSNKNLGKVEMQQVGDQIKYINPKPKIE